MLKRGGTCIVSTHHPVNDFAHFSQQDYFSKRLIEDEWTGFEPPMKVKYFVRPLHGYMQPMIECKLTLKAIKEPGPVEILKQEDEKIYNRLLTRPVFLFYILEKDAHEEED